MPRVILAVMLVLAGCSDRLQGGNGVTSIVQFDSARFAGDWQVLAGYGADAACGPLSETWALGSQGFAVSGTACGARGTVPFTATAQMTGPGPGRMGLRDAAGTRPVWVLWVDADYRIAVLGAPDGSGGRIVGRSSAARSDLMVAAREVLEFNGYDLARLRGL